MKKYKKITVTMTQDYFVEMIDNERTTINGWSIDDVSKDWFRDHSMDMYHATRDGHRIGNSRVIQKIEINDL